MPAMKDTIGAPDTETDDGAGTRPVIPRAPLLVSTAEAARLAGVNPRTVRRWIERGYLSHVDGPNGSGISPADLPAAKEAAARAGGGGHPTDTFSGGLGRPSGQGTDTSGGHPPTGVVSARQQLEAIRDEWLLPLVDRIGNLEREAGQLHERVVGVERERDDLAARLAEDRTLADQLVNVLQAERDAALAEVERLKAAQNTPVAAQELHHEARPLNVAPDTPPSWWVSWWRRLVGGGE